RDLYGRIIKILEARGTDLRAVKRSDISAVDEFHVRGAEVSIELASALQLRNKRVLDVGCGIGGPCRMLADEYDCTTTGIDLSREFITTAEKLSALVGLEHKTSFVYGNATNLPFEDQSFDLVWTQHVQMNVKDKKKFYQEIARVLIPDGSFLYYDIFKKGKEEIAYPLPWANKSKISFLSETSVMEDILKDLGLKKEHSSDQTEKGIKFFENLLNTTPSSGPPKLGLSLLMGEGTKLKLTNLLNALKDQKLVLQSGIYSK
ncbi:MAG: methyltransferase domain-containing protein, partial [Eudoraea sp.]|nr:methyltransferase domain-containing protein [Eudoraea sp.]